MRLVRGVGINDLDAPTEAVIDGVRIACPFYLRWSSMLNRAYSETYQHRFPTYKGIKVCEEWHYRSKFTEWMKTQDWQGKHLDKDILASGTESVYSPTTCVFVTPEVNMLLTDSRKTRGVYPLGVTLRVSNGKFNAACHVEGKNKTLGCFHTAQEAHKAWQLFKAKVIEEVANRQVDIRVKDALLLRTRQLLADAEAGRETLKL